MLRPNFTQLTNIINQHPVRDVSKLVHSACSCPQPWRLRCRTEAGWHTTKFWCGHPCQAAAGPAELEWGHVVDLHSTQTTGISGFAPTEHYHAGKLVAGIGELKGDWYWSRGGGHGLKSLRNACGLGYGGGVGGGGGAVCITGIG